MKRRGKIIDPVKRQAVSIAWRVTPEGSQFVLEMQLASKESDSDWILVNKYGSQRKAERARDLLESKRLTAEIVV